MNYMTKQALILELEKFYGKGNITVYMTSSHRPIVYYGTALMSRATIYGRTKIDVNDIYIVKKTNLDLWRELV